MAVIVAEAQIILSSGMPLLNRLAIPLHGLGIVLGDTQAFIVAVAQSELAPAVPHLRCFAGPLHGLGIVLGFTVCAPIVVFCDVGYLLRSQPCKFIRCLRLLLHHLRLLLHHLWLLLHHLLLHHLWLLRHAACSHEMLGHGAGHVGIQLHAALGRGIAYGYYLIVVRPYGQVNLHFAVALIGLRVNDDHSRSGCIVDGQLLRLHQGSTPLRHHQRQHVGHLALHALDAVVAEVDEQRQEVRVLHVEHVRALAYVHPVLARPEGHVANDVALKLGTGGSQLHLHQCTRVAHFVVPRLRTGRQVHRRRLHPLHRQLLRRRHEGQQQEQPY